MKRCETVDEYIATADCWRDELSQLRKILCSTELQEDVKWGGPCYTIDGKNVVGMGAFKSYFGLWFFQGALLQDKEKVLVNAQDGKTKALRQWRFKSKREINARRIKAYLGEAIALAKSGKEIKVERSTAVAIPPELTKALRANNKVKACFGKLTKGKQREYADYIAEAKRADTKLKRLEKIIPMILANQGLNDKYRN